MKYIWMILCFSFLSVSQGFEFNLKDRILTNKFYETHRDILYGSTKYSNRDRFKYIYHTLTLKTRKRIDHFIKSTHPHIPEEILMPLIYWRFLRNNRTKTAKTLTYLFLDKILILRDYAEDPLFRNRVKVQNKLREITRINDLRTDEIFKRVYPLLQEKSKLLTSMGDDVFIQALMETNLFTLDLTEVLENQSFLLDKHGYIPGNKITFLHQDTVEQEDFDWFSKNFIFNGGVLDPDAPYMKMPYRNSHSGHRSFKQNPIFKSLKQIIDNSYQTLFINTDHIGGTIGGTLIKYLLDKTKEKLLINQNFKVLIMLNSNTQGFIKKETIPVYQLLEKRLLQDKDLFKAIKVFYSKGEKNDKSNFLIADSNSKSPELWMSTKQFNDSKGGLSLDSAIHLSGPAAALIQSTYLDEIKNALQGGANTFLNLGDDQSPPNYLEDHERFLEYYTINRANYPFIGTDWVRISADSLEKDKVNIRNTIVDMILKARESIFIEQKFLIDSYIVNALIKKKISLPSLEVKIILDNNESLGLGGIPNTIFMKELTTHDIKLMTRKSLSRLVTFPNGKKAPLYQTNEKSTISVDESAVLITSAKLTPHSLEGEVRNIGIQIFSKPEIKRLDSMFLKDWNSEQKTMVFDIENFQMVSKSKKYEKDFSSIINNISRMLIKNLENFKPKPTPPYNQ